MKHMVDPGGALQAVVFESHIGILQKDGAFRDKQARPAAEEAEARAKRRGGKKNGKNNGSQEQEGEG